MIDLRRIKIFLLFSFGIAWSSAIVIALTGGIQNSPEVIPNSGIRLSLILLAGVYMFAPAIANYSTRSITKEGWASNQLSLAGNKWKYWFIGMIAPALITVIGAITFFWLFPSTYDSTFSVLRDGFSKLGKPLPIPPIYFLLAQLGVAILVSPIANGLFTFGEEYGWRGYLLQKLEPLGTVQAVLSLGVIWGVWHWPVIAMGHNYGLDYFGAPWLGMLMMVWITICLGTFLSWLTIRSGNVWPAVIGHAAINGVSAISAYVTIGKPNPLLGPLPVGLIGSIGWTILTIFLLIDLMKNPQKSSKTAEYLQ